MLLFLEIMAVIFMATMIFVAIWSFIILNQIFGQMRYKNYLLEKLTQNVYMLSVKNTVVSKENDNGSEADIKVEE